MEYRLLTLQKNTGFTRGKSESKAKLTVEKSVEISFPFRREVRRFQQGNAGPVTELPVTYIFSWACMGIPSFPWQLDRFGIDCL